MLSQSLQRRLLEAEYFSWVQYLQMRCGLPAAYPPELVTLASDRQLLLAIKELKVIAKKDLLVAKG